MLPALVQKENEVILSHQVVNVNFDVTKSIKFSEEFQVTSNNLLRATKTMNDCYI